MSWPDTKDCVIIRSATDFGPITYKLINGKGETICKGDPAKLRSFISKNFNKPSEICNLHLIYGG